MPALTDKRPLEVQTCQFWTCRNESVLPYVLQDAQRTVMLCLHHKNIIKSQEDLGLFSIHLSLEGWVWLDTTGLDKRGTLDE